VVQAQAGIAAVSIAQIVPESVNSFIWIQVTDAVRPSLTDQLLVTNASLFTTTRRQFKELVIKGISYSLHGECAIASQKFGIRRSRIMQAQMSAFIVPKVV